MSPLVAPILAIGQQLIDRLFPDPGQKAEAQFKLLELAQNGELAQVGAAVQMSQAQAEVNKAEAGSGDPYTRRWRPTIGYVIGAALGFHYILNPLLLWIAALIGSDVKPPAIELDEHLWELILGMLGLAGWRTLDKVRGKA